MLEVLCAVLCVSVCAGGIWFLADAVNCRHHFCVIVAILPLSLGFTMAAHSAVLYAQNMVLSVIPQYEPLLGHAIRDPSVTLQDWLCVALLLTVGYGSMVLLRRCADTIRLLKLARRAVAHVKAPEKGN